MTSIIKKIISSFSFLNNSEKIYRFFIILVTLFAIIVSIGTFAYYYQRDLTIIFGDARSRLNIADRVIFSKTPGITQLGGIWLPLPSIFMIPTIWLNNMHYSGLSGSIPSMLFFILAGVFISKIVFKISHSYSSSVIAVIIFFSNPSMQYIQTTAMTESILIGLVLLSIYYLLVWSKNLHQLSYLIISSFFAFLATLTRYEGWIYTIIATLVVCSVTWLKSKKRIKVEGNIILFSIIAFFGIFLWLLYNYTIFGDVLNFTHEAGSTNFYVSQQLMLGKSSSIWNLPNAIWSYLRVSFNTVGWVNLFFAIIGLIMYLKRNLRSYNIFIAPLILALPIFHVFSLFFGTTYLVNRYGLYIVPFTAIFVSILFEKTNKLIKLVLFLIIISQSIFLYFSKSPVLIEALEASNSSEGKAQYDIANWLTKNPAEGTILISTLANENIIFLAKLPSKNIVYEGNGTLWQNALQFSDKTISRVIILKNINMDPIQRIVLNNPEKLNNYKVVYNSTFYQVYDQIN